MDSRSCKFHLRGSNNHFAKNPKIKFVSSPSPSPPLPPSNDNDLLDKIAEIDARYLAAYNMLQEEQRRFKKIIEDAMRCAAYDRQREVSDALKSHGDEPTADVLRQLSDKQLFNKFCHKFLSDDDKNMISYGNFRPTTTLHDDSPLNDDYMTILKPDELERDSPKFLVKSREFYLELLNSPLLIELQHRKYVVRYVHVFRSAGR